MTEIRCPMCGKENLGDLDECQFCQARLKPLIISTEGDSSELEDEQNELPDIPLPDWLESLKSDGHVDSESLIDDEIFDIGVGDDKSQELAEENLLDVLRAQTSDELDDLPDQEGMIGDESPDWLKRIRTLHDTEIKDEFNQARSTEEPDLSESTDTDVSLELSADEIDVFDETSSSVLSKDDSVVVDLEDKKADSVESQIISDWIDQEGIESEPGSEGASSEDRVPDWLDGLGQGSMEFETEDDQPTELLDDRDADRSTSDDIEIDQLPDWLSEQTDGGADTEGIFDADDLFPSEDSLADWIKEDTDVEPEPADTSDDQVIESAELPAWMEAMRPSADAVQIENDAATDGQYIESAGPLAGLRSALAAEPEIAKLKKPSIYVGRLQVTERQHAHAALLEELIESESVSEELPQPKKDQNQMILRWVISVLLLIILAYQIIDAPDDQSYLDPGRIPPGVLDANRLIGQIAQGEIVLVGFDYQPALSGEMDVAASVIIDHLMSKGAQLAIVSSNPTGPILSENIIKKQGKKYGFTMGKQAINLGIIPGGASGLLAFAESPRLIAPGEQDGSNAWESRALESISKLTDFSIIVLITDDADLTRTWIEQIQPNLNDVPLIIVTSAQADPLVLPYYDEEGQVRGLVSGIAGAAAYGQLTGEQTPSSNYWSAYNFGLMTGGIVMMLGIIYNLFKFSTSRNQKRKPKD